MRIRSLLLGIICGTSFLSAQNLLVLPVTGQFDRESDATTLDGLYHEAMQAKFKGNVMAPVAGAYCGAMNCAIQIANENGADAVVYSTVSRLGTKWVFSSTIMNTGGGRSYTQSFAAGSIEDMAGVADSMAEALTDNFTNTRGVSNSDLRIPHVFAFGAEIGMNSLASLIGFTGTFFIVPQVAVDMGLGLSVTGLHTGVRGRYLFSPKKLSPFAYGGVEYSSGLGTYTETLTDNGNSNTLTVTVNAATFIDAGLGFDYMANNGFYWVACFGWSQLLGGQNFAWAPGSYPTSDDNSAQKLIDGSGPTLSFSGGYAF